MSDFSSLHAVFEVDSKEIDVLSFNYSLSQSIDDRGRVSSLVHGGTVFLQLDTKDEDMKEIFKWMVEPATKKNCKILFRSISDKDKNVKTIELQDAYCVSYSESFTDRGPLAVSITLSAKELKYDNIPHTNHA